MAKPIKVSLAFTPCSLLMASLFAYSASVQLNDPDWYFWFPLYGSATIVNLLHHNTSSRDRNALAKVVVEDYVGGLAGFWSLDMSERVVREKLGSGLVVASMCLQLKASALAKEPSREKAERTKTLVDFGMVLLVAVSFGLLLLFCVCA
ncbi:hypothetical protein QJS10_CPB17g02584 [Acorus calamus]|uniref:Transmembrane protein 220 n=1 Tax=Acorus calamus TaxID=4465 RepID=A0AAV9CUR8_ACOCL|nr:hypothetical protein QJS10_CPB17g02584 [Acorus calamus]